MIRIAISLRLRARSFFTGGIFRISWNSTRSPFVNVRERRSMQNRTKILALMATAAILTSCDIEDIGSFGDSHAYRKDFHYSYALKPGGRLSLESFNGQVEIT